MLKITKKRRRKERRKRMITAGVLLIGSSLFLWICILGVRNTSLWNRLQYQICYLMLKQYAPVLTAGDGEQTAYQIEDDTTMYDMQSESQLSYDQILVKKDPQETQTVDASAGNSDTDANQTDPENTQSNEADASSGDVATTAVSAGGNAVSLEKLNDFDYLIQHYYTVDKSTTINSSQLVVQNLLNKDCTIQKTTEDVPQILIYHTHSQETFADSRPGERADTVIGLGDDLQELLEKQYGYEVLHITEAFDMKEGCLERSRAYNYAEPVIAAALEEHPSIQVVIDLHRDGVNGSKRLVTEINGKPTAQIMFFNGLSRTKESGELTSLPNPYQAENLAFSFQMEYEAKQYYPGFSRCIYLKGYRYNLHLRPRSVLLEVGAQTNTVEEVKNAMGPFADILHKVLSGKSPASGG